MWPIKTKDSRFNLRLRTILVVAGSLALVLAILVTYSNTIVKEGFLSIEERDAVLNANRMQDAFDQQVDNLDVKMIDWSTWDDAFAFMESGNSEFIESNLTLDTLLSMQLDLMLFLKPDMSLVWGQQLDSVQGSSTEVHAAIISELKAYPELTTFAEPNDRKKGILNLPGMGPTFLVISPIIKSKGEFPSNGLLISGRKINEAMIQKIEKLTHLSIRLIAPEDAPSDPLLKAELEAFKTQGATPSKIVNEDTIVSYKLLLDLNNRPVFFGEISLAREIYAQGNKTIQDFIIALIVGGFALGLAVIISLEHSVISRIRALARSLQTIRKSGDLSSRVEENGKDEITELATSTNKMLESIERGQAEVNLKNDDMKRILDNAEEGFIGVNLKGEIVGEHSKIITSWFGNINKGDKIWEYLHQDDTRKARFFEVGWDQLVSNILPFDVMADQLPLRIHHKTKNFQARVLPIYNEAKLMSVLMVLSDITEVLKAELKEREQKESMKLFQTILHDRSAVVEFFEETSQQVSGLLRFKAKEHNELLRTIHTLKGNAAQQGLGTFAEICHHLETKLIDDPIATASVEELREIVRAWKDVEGRFMPLLKDRDIDQVFVSRNEYKHLIEEVRHKSSYDSLANILYSWDFEPAEQRLTRLGVIAEGLCTRLAKPIAILNIQDNHIRIDKDILKDFWASMVHVIRNAIDHGIESPQERREKSKAESGHITLTTRALGEELWVQIGDDGRGVNWEALRKAALKKGLASSSDQDLINALFADQISTKSEVTEISGRGVGMAAIKDSVEKLGGRIQIDTVKDQGSIFSFIFPRARVPFLQFEPRSQREEHAA